MMMVQRFGPRPVAFGVLAWSLAMGVCFFVARSVHHVGISSGASSAAYWFACTLTVLAGSWLGWRHRTGTAFVAPLLAWVVLVPFAFASEFLRAGFLGGLWRGFVVAIFFGFVVSALEAIVLVAFAMLGRMAGGVLHHGDPSESLIIPPRLR
jgi:hypothetical protein